MTTSDEPRLLGPQSSGTRVLVRAGFALCAGWLLCNQLLAVPWGDAEPGVAFGPRAHIGVLTIVVTLAFAGAWATPRPRRGPALLIASGVAAWSLGELYYVTHFWEDASPPSPSPADLGYAAFPVLLLAAGAAVIPGARAGGAAMASSAVRWTDAAIAALAVGGLSAALLFEAIATAADGQFATIATWAAYPLADLALISIGVGTLASIGWKFNRQSALLFAGVCLFWFADIAAFFAVVNSTYEASNGFEVGWYAGLALIAGALWCRPAPSRIDCATPIGILVVPLCFGLLAVWLLLYAGLSELHPLAVILAASSLVAVLVRLGTTFRENVRLLGVSQDEASTDPLTGLGNRRALALEFDRRLPAADEQSPLLLVLCDLNGFKRFNDTFGHPSGDALLARLGAQLQTRVAASGSAYRLGGDEFCVLVVTGSGIPPVTFVEVCEALSEHGEDYDVTCSSGTVTLPAEANDLSSALALADERLYSDKRRRRSVPCEAGSAPELSIRHDTVAPAW